MTRWICFLCLAMACGDKTKEEEGPGPAPDKAPDVTGRYNVQIAGATGCEGQSYWLESWVPGALTIEGNSESLRFDFGGGVELGGAVDANKKFSFAGEAKVEIDIDTGMVDANLRIFNDGTFEHGEDGCLVMDGDFSVVVDETGLEQDECTISAPVKAYQLEGAACDGLQGG